MLPFIVLCVVLYHLALLLPIQSLTSGSNATGTRKQSQSWVPWLLYTLVKYGFSFWHSKSPAMVLASGTFPAPVEYLLSLPSARGQGAVAVGVAFMAVESVVTRTISMIREQVSR